MTQPQKFELRSATAGDANSLVKLIDIAGEGIPSWLWSKSCENGKDILNVGEERARRESGGFSYRNALLATRQERILGMVLSYAIDEAPDADTHELPDPIAPFVELEAKSVGTWYINALAVNAGQRGAGIGTKLLLAAESTGKQAGYNAISIQVYSQNTGAVGLYTQLGYETVARTPVLLHPCQPYYDEDVLLMIKQLSD